MGRRCSLTAKQTPASQKGRCNVGEAKSKKAHPKPKKNYTQTLSVKVDEATKSVVWTYRCKWWCPGYWLLLAVEVFKTSFLIQRRVIPAGAVQSPQTKKTKTPEGYKPL